MVTTFGYDSASRLNALTQNLTGTANDLTLGFTFNPASQILQRSQSGTAYDPPTPANSNVAYTPDGLNRYANVGGVSFTYDDRSNLTGDGARTFGYDLENRLLSVGGSASMSLAYDPVGRLRQTIASSTTTDFLYDGDTLRAEYNGATLLRRYVHGPGVDEPIVWYEGAALTDRRFLIADNQGSVIGTSDGSGNSSAIYSYDPYGRPNAWSGARFRYTGQIMLPEAALYHYRARVYDPALGRFLQTDPIGYDDDINMYAYAGDNPTNAADPTGEECVTVDGGTGAEAVCDRPQRENGLSGPQREFLALTHRASNNIVRSYATEILPVSFGLFVTIETFGGAGLLQVPAAGILEAMPLRAALAGRTAQQWRSLLGWGANRAGAIARLSRGISRADVAAMRAQGLTRAMVIRIRDGYLRAQALNRGGDVADVRALLMDRILSNW